MSAKIFYTPASIEASKSESLEWPSEEFFQSEMKYIADLTEFCIRKHKQENIGKSIHFYVADGFAEYMVLSMKPLNLLHIPIGVGEGGGYEFPHVKNLTQKDVLEQLSRESREKLIWPKIQSMIPKKT